MDLMRPELVLSARPDSSGKREGQKGGLGSDPIGECKFMLKTRKSLPCPFCSLLQCLSLCGHLWGGKQKTRDSNGTLIPN